ACTVSFMVVPSVRAWEFRMEEAKRLLREDTVKIKDVAERSGYADSRYFSKVFSKAFGITPKEYRRLHCWRT
ncbi:MAG: helix-turn-helix transcriptional regulator, partial [Lachnospiraceae bacterium]